MTGAKMPTPRRARSVTNLRLPERCVRCCAALCNSARDRDLTSRPPQLAAEARAARAEALRGEAERAASAAALLAEERARQAQTAHASAAALLQALSASDRRMCDVESALGAATQERQWLETQLARQLAEASAAAERLNAVTAASELARDLVAADQAELCRLRHEAQEAATLATRFEEERQGRARAETALEQALNVQAEMQSRHIALTNRCNAVIAENEALLCSHKAAEKQASASLGELRAAAVNAREEVNRLKREVGAAEMRAQELHTANVLLDERCGRFCTALSHCRPHLRIPTGRLHHAEAIAVELRERNSAFELNVVEQSELLQARASAAAEEAAKALAAAERGASARAEAAQLAAAARWERQMQELNDSHREQLAALKTSLEAATAAAAAAEGRLRDANLAHQTALEDHVSKTTHEATLAAVRAEAFAAQRVAVDSACERVRLENMQGSASAAEAHHALELRCTDAEAQARVLDVRCASLQGEVLLASERESRAAARAAAAEAALSLAEARLTEGTESAHVLSLRCSGLEGELIAARAAAHVADAAAAHSARSHESEARRAASLEAALVAAREAEVLLQAQLSAIRLDFATREHHLQSEASAAKQMQLSATSVAAERQGQLAELQRRLDEAESRVAAATSELRLAAQHADARQAELHSRLAASSEALADAKSSAAAAEVASRHAVNTAQSSLAQEQVAREVAEREVASLKLLLDTEKGMAERLRRQAEVAAAAALAAAPSLDALQAELTAARAAQDKAQASEAAAALKLADAAVAVERAIAREALAVQEADTLRQHIATADAAATSAAAALHEAKLLATERAAAADAMVASAHAELSANEQAHSSAVARLREELSSAEKAHSSEVKMLQEQLCAAEKAHSAAMNVLREELGSAEKMRSSELAVLREQLSAAEKVHASEATSLREQLSSAEKAHASEVMSVREQLLAAEQRVSEAAITANEAAALALSHSEARTASWRADLATSLRAELAALRLTVESICTAAEADVAGARDDAVLTLTAAQRAFAAREARLTCTFESHLAELQERLAAEIERRVVAESVPSVGGPVG